MVETCPYCCSHDKRAYFAQLRADGVKVVSQRCAKCLRPWKGQPFVSMHGFDWNSLPRWSDDGPQSELPTQKERPASPPRGRAVIGTIEYIEEKRKNR